jgi:integrase
MSYRQRGNSYQVDVQYKGQRVREDVASEEQAIEREAQIKLALMKGTWNAPVSAPTRNASTLTLGALKDRVYALVWSKQKAARESDSVARLVVSFFGAERSVVSIDRRTVGDFRLALARAGNSPATINRKLASLSKMLSVAHDEGWIADRPRITRERESEGRDRFLTHEEEDKLIAVLRVWGQHDAADLVMFLLDTGCRLGEALTLRWTEVTLNRVTFVGAHTKNSLTRPVPLTARLIDMVNRKVKALGPSLSGVCTGLVFPGFDGGRKFRKVWDRAKRHMGLAADPHFVIHILRHTCASRLLQGGADLEYVRRWLGHKDIKMTQRYAHLAPTSLDKLTAILEARPEQPRHLGVVEGGKSG